MTYRPYTHVSLKRSEAQVAVKKIINKAFDLILISALTFTLIEFVMRQNGF